jgi:hypothetical protein
MPESWSIDMPSRGDWKYIFGSDVKVGKTGSGRVVSSVYAVGEGSEEATFVC